MNRHFVIISLFSLIFLLILGFTLSEAATLRINPTKVRLIITPGESKSGVIEVENPSEEAITVKAYLQDWKYTSVHDGTKEFFASGVIPLSCADWVTVSLPEFVLSSYGKQKLNYTVKVPKEAAGGHYAVLFFESLLGKPELKENAALGVVVRIGALFYIEPDGSIERLAEVSNFSVQTLKDKPLQINLDFKNTGNVDITCKGTFHIMDKQGMVVARGNFNDSYTFPGEIAKLNAAWKYAIPKGKYDLIMTFDIGKALEEAGLGRGPVITKESTLEIGENGQVLKFGGLK